MMKIIKNIFIALSICCMFVFSACFGNNKDNKNSASGTVNYNFSVNTNEVTLEVGEKFQLFATYGDQALTYTSLNLDVATVSSTGEIVAVQEGTTFIKIQAEEESTNVKVIVENPEYSIEINESSDFVMFKNASKIFTVTLKKDGAIVNEKVNVSCDKSQMKVVETTNTSAVIIASEVGYYDVTFTHESGVSLTLSVKVISETAQKLATPSVSISANVVTWEAVENASGYEVKQDGGEWTLISETTFNLADENVECVYIRAVCDGFDFYDSDVVSVTVNA